MPEQSQHAPVAQSVAQSLAQPLPEQGDSTQQALPFMLRGLVKEIAQNHDRPVTSGGPDGAERAVPVAGPASRLLQASSGTEMPGGTEGALARRMLLPSGEARAAVVEAAAAAVLQAAAAVEAAARTVHAAAAAVDMAASAIALAGTLELQAAPRTADLPPVGLLPPDQPADLRTGSPWPSAHASGAAPGSLLAWPTGLAGLTTAADPRTRFRRVAIIHYWLVTMRGGERVLERLLELFPGADIFTHVYDPAAMSDAINARTVHTSFIQKLPGARQHYQTYLPLMPLALEQLDLRGYDLVISSESGPAKGVIPAPDALHLCYVHSPMRYLWDHYHDYRADAGWLKRAVMPLLCHRLRQWDTSSAARVDRVLANSRFIQSRIAKAWRREADVVHPPVDSALFAPSDDVEPGYLWVGQLVPYKRADLAIDAFNALGLPLTVVGDGPQAAALRKRAGPTIRMIPRLSFDELRRAYARCRALVFTAEEDFGIIPVEVMASGRPVIAYGRGGALDSVVAERTGLFFDAQTPEALIDTVRRMEAWLPHFNPGAALARARDFAPERFDSGILEALACG
ncbi:MAG: glycosyltransferase [Novosphingobium sp.]